MKILFSDCICNVEINWKIHKNSVIDHLFTEASVMVQQHWKMSMEGMEAYVMVYLASYRIVLIEALNTDEYEINRSKMKKMVPGFLTIVIMVMKNFK